LRQQQKKKKKRLLFQLCVTFWGQVGSLVFQFAQHMRMVLYRFT